MWNLFPGAIKLKAPVSCNCLKFWEHSKGDSFKLLYKDYLGSIMLIGDEERNELEQWHYDAWRNFTHLQIGSKDIIIDDKIVH